MRIWKRAGGLRWPHPSAAVGGGGGGGSWAQVHVTGTATAEEGGIVGLRSHICE